ncbi:MAG: ABC transporter permease, partial [Clostridium sp.]
EKDELSIILSKPYSDKDVGLETRLLQKNEKFKLDMKSGTSFDRDTLKDDGNNGIYSSRLDEEFVQDIIGTEESIKISKIGSYYQTDRIVIVSNKLFEKLYKNISIKEILICVKGDTKAIKNLVVTLEKKFENKKRDNAEGDILETSMPTVENLVESKTLYKASILIFIVTIINSISISSLWVKNRKKEIVLRKVFGAKNKDIVKIFFGELALISLVALILAVIIQQILVNTTIGFISNIDLRLNFESLIYSIIVSIGVAFLTAIPSVRHISKVQPAEMLKED